MHTKIVWYVSWILICHWKNRALLKNTKGLHANKNLKYFSFTKKFEKKLLLDLIRGYFLVSFLCFSRPNTSLYITWLAIIWSRLPPTRTFKLHQLKRSNCRRIFCVPYWYLQCKTLIRIFTFQCLNFYSSSF